MDLSPLVLLYGFLCIMVSHSWRLLSSFAGFLINGSMGCASERVKEILPPISLSPSQTDSTQLPDIDMNGLNVETEDTFVTLLEMAANNDVEGFKRWIQRDPSAIDEVGLWYGRQKGSKQMVLEDRTPLMVAATYGSVDVLSLILSLSEADVNQSCGLDKTTALHCAASSGSLKSIDVVKLLLSAGADPNLIDANGYRPADVILVSPKFQDMKLVLGELLVNNGPDGINDLRVSCATSNSNPSLLSPSSPENRSPSSASNSTSSPKITNFDDLNSTFAAEKKEYPVDPSLPDIKNGIYSTDEFRMFSFKVRPCSRAYSHDWTECPFVHPGENARRRDPRKYHYSCVPCPDFRKGACRRGDMCEYAHGVFECWLHPAQYRTRLCKDGISCNRRVCFFAHKHEELRPLYVSTGSAVPSPHSNTTAASGMDFAAAMSLLPSSPSSVCAMSSSPFTPPMSPSANGLQNLGWHQANVPTLQLPGSNLQSSRLRSSLNARDIHAEDMNLLQDFDMQQQQLLHEFSRLSQPNVSANSLNRSVRSRNLTPSNLDDIFSSESLSPRYSDPPLASSVFSPRQNSSILNQFHQQQSMLSPINTNFSPNKVDNPLQNSYATPLGRMSPRNMEPISPLSSRVSTFAQREQQQFRSLSSRELGSSSSFSVGSPGDSWPKWGSSNGNAEWNVNNKDFGQLKRSATLEANTNEEEPDLSWVQSLVKESHHEANQDSVSHVPGAAGIADASFSNSSNLNSGIEPTEQSVLGAWIEQMQLDQMLAQ
ncbi:zinc finger CCCH domain-containing protein 30 isoform X1 [Daucus carota subsp. sativus]